MRKLKRRGLSPSSAIFMSMVTSPAILYLSFYLKQTLTGKGDGFAPVLLLTVFICVALIGAIGLGLNGLLFLRMRVMTQDSDVYRRILAVARYAVLVMTIFFGSLAAYLIWPLGKLSTWGAFLGSAISLAGFIGAAYVAVRLWR